MGQICDPSNTLACLNGLAEDTSRRRVLGPDVAIRVHTYDETNRRVRPNRIIRIIQRVGGRALVGLVGVQSNQFPRAVDLARPFLRAGLPVCIGGFHVSGSIAMLPEMPREMREAVALGISFFAGEAEHGRLDRVIRATGCSWPPASRSTRFTPGPRARRRDSNRRAVEPRRRIIVFFQSLEFYVERARFVRLGTKHQNSNYGRILNNKTIWVGDKN
jgi:hypothetical protein